MGHTAKDRPTGLAAHADRKALSHMLRLLLALGKLRERRACLELAEDARGRGPTGTRGLEDHRHETDAIAGALPRRVAKVRLKPS